MPTSSAGLSPEARQRAEAAVRRREPGRANGGIGADFVAKSAPDGYTLLVTASGPSSSTPCSMPRLPYDPVRDSRPSLQCTVYQYVL